MALNAVFGRSAVLPKRIDGFQGTCVIACSCDSPVPILIPFIPGAIGSGAECGRCGRIWGVSEMHFTMENNQPNMKIVFACEKPAIVRPGT